MSSATKSNGRVRIGVPDRSMRGWAAGAVVTRTMALSLQAAGAEVVFLTRNPEQAPAGVRSFLVTDPHYWPGEWTARKVCRLGERSLMAAAARGAEVDVLLPDVEALKDSSFRTVGWIPDFQHLHLGELYTDEHKRELNQAFRKLSERAGRMLFSSEDCRVDFVRAYPEFAGKARVASFPSLFAFEPPGTPVVDVVEKYQLPRRFLLVVNQFWRHKNHRVVPEALALLRKQGVSVPVVMAGLPADHRDRQNQALTDTLQAAAVGGVWPQCFILGKISREDLIALLQTAAAVIQPSRFEGWNTTVQDAKALGCPLIVSDLAVHREQCPGALGFFPPEDAAALAEIIARHWPQLPTRPDAPREQQALAAELDFARDYGRRLLEICSEPI